MRFIAVLFLCSLLLAACTKSRSTPGKEGQPGAKAAPGAKASVPAAPPGAPAPPPAAPGEAPSPQPTIGSGPDNVEPKIPTRDGPALSTFLTDLAEIVGGDSGVTKAGTIKSIVSALNPSQSVGGKRKACPFSHFVLFKGKDGKTVGSLGICSPLGANTKGIYTDNKTGNEWQVTIPDSKKLGGLLDKHLPASKEK